MAYYTYQHRAGYGRDDHMADEIIARAARQLGLDTGDAIAKHCGLASHSCPMPGGEVRLPSAPGVRQRMERALQAARGEFARRPDCCVEVVLRRVRVETEGRSWRVDGFLVGETIRTRIVEERDGLQWRTISTEVVP